jgi:hypothetical protein
VRGRRPPEVGRALFSGDHKTDIKQLLKQAKRRQTTERVCLRGDLAGEYEDLEREVAKLPKSNKLGGDPERQRIQAEMDRLREEMQAGTVPFVLQALPEPAFQRLVDEHPPREKDGEADERDVRAGYDRSTFFHALIRASVVDPELDADDWSLLFEEALSPGQFMQLGLAALQINNQEVDVPFSSAASSERPD